MGFRETPEKGGEGAERPPLLVSLASQVSHSCPGEDEEDEEAQGSAATEKRRSGV